MQINYTRQRYCVLAMLLGLLQQPLAAQTTVDVSTSLGDFSIELFDEITPQTVENFLNYVESGRFDGTVIHRSEPDFVIQGGWLTYDEELQTFFQIDTDPAVINEFSLSNLRGTVAMAKRDGDPDSATSQWFINVVDNRFLDNSNGGFTVFGRVLGDGMDVVDAINALPLVNLVPGLGPFPLVGFDGVSFATTNLVTVEMSVAPEAVPQVEPANRYDDTTGQLLTRVIVDGAASYSLAFTIFATDPVVTIQALAESVQPLGDSQSDYASFDSTTGRLLLPELVIAGEVAFRNVSFLLTDAQQLLFQLESFE